MDGEREAIAARRRNVNKMAEKRPLSRQSNIFTRLFRGPPTARQETAREERAEPFSRL